MQNNIKFNRYYNTKSEAHEMHPLSKILCTIIFIIIVCLAKSIWLNSILLVLLTINILLTNVPFKVYLKTIRSLWLILLIIFLINMLIGMSIFGNVITIIKISEVFLYSSIISITTNPQMIQKGFEGLLKPLKYIGVPIYRLAFMITMILNFIPDIFEIKDRIIKSQASRGIDYKKGSLKGKILSIKSMTIPLFVFSKNENNELTSMMEVRLYDINKKHKIDSIKWDLYASSIIIFYMLILVLTIIEEVL